MPDLPLALRDRLDERAVGPVVVKMPPPRPFAEPEKRSVLQPDRVDARILPALDPRVARFPQQRTCGAGSRIGAVEIQPRLTAILNLKNDVVGRRPAHADDQEVRVLGGVNRPVRSGICSHVAYLYHWIWI